MSTVREERDFHYAVLNLPNSASQQEIRERYRSLSIIFHPDKQHDDSSKDTAAKKFLEIQKAYEVLSDPFLREVYDTLGPEGLSIKFSPDVRSKPLEELRLILRRAMRARTQEQLENLIRPRGKLTCAINASSIFEEREMMPTEGWLQALRNIFDEVRVSNFGLRQSIRKELDEKTAITITARMAREMSRSPALRANSHNILGTIRHQYSPRLAFGVTGTVFRPHFFIFEANYRDDDTTLLVQWSTSPAILQLLAPNITISVSRRLFPKSMLEGLLTVKTGSEPTISVNLVSPSSFDLTSDLYLPYREKSGGTTPGSVSGLGIGARYTTYGLILAGSLNSSARIEYGVTFSELALQVKLGLELGIAGAAGLLSGSWANKTSEIAASVGLSHGGVFLRLDLSYIGQRLSIPIALSQDFDAALAFFASVVPSSAIILGYHFFLKPRRLAQRAIYFQNARAVLDEDRSSLKRENEETLSLLRDTARKHMDVERSKGGLVILGAIYGPTDTDDEATGLNLDVTVPLQALVHNSQLYVAPHQIKAGLQGFYDPAPSSLKHLRVRYMFRGREHYAEIPDYASIVLPLEDHIIQ